MDVDAEWLSWGLKSCSEEVADQVTNRLPGQRAHWGRLIRQVLRHWRVGVPPSPSAASTLLSTQVLWPQREHKQEAYLVAIQVLLTQEGWWS